MSSRRVRSGLRPALAGLGLGLALVSCGADAWLAHAQDPSASGLERSGRPAPASPASPAPPPSTTPAPPGDLRDRIRFGLEPETDRTPGLPAPPSWGFTSLVELVTSLWTDFQSKLEFERKVGEPTRLEPGTQAAIQVAFAEIDGYFQEWRLRNPHRFVEAEELAGGGGLAAGRRGTLVLDADATKEVLSGAERIFRRHIDPKREGPDLLAYVLTQNNWIRDNWRDGAKIERKLLDYGWIVGLGIIAYQAGTDRARFSVDVKVLEDKERDLRVGWKTKIEHFGVHLEPEVKTGLLVEKKLLTAEALIGARLVRDGWDYGIEQPEASLKIEHRWLDLIHPSNPRTYVRLRTDVRLPLSEPRRIEDRIAVRNTVGLTHQFGAGSRLDLGVHEETVGDRFATLGLGARYTPGSAQNLSIFCEANYNNHRGEELYSGPRDEFSFFLGLICKF
jgi:hypothetical protein